jgi:hypothetical protein
MDSTKVTVQSLEASMILDFVNNIQGPMLFFNTQTMRIKSMIHNSIAVIYLKTHTLAGIEPGPPLPQAGAMSTSTRRQGLFDSCCLARY